MSSLVSASSQTALISAAARQSPERTAGSSLVDVRSTYILIAIIGAAVLLRLYGISMYALQGDEYQSLAEAKFVGLNWNSVIYSTLLHFWMKFGASEFWLRLPAAIFGVATIPVLFKVGEKLGGWRTGAVAALLAATSPFNIFHSQEMRFYSLLMFAASLFLLATVHYVQSEQKTNRNLLSLVGAASLLLVTHFLALIAVWAQGTAAFLAVKRRRAVTTLAVTPGIPLVIFGLPLLPPVRVALIRLYAAVGNAQHADAAGTTPLSIASVAKMVFAGFTFTFGYHVYPMRLVLVVIGSAVTGLLLVCGTVRLVRQRNWWALIVTHLVALVGIYVVLDSVGGRVTTGVSPRHVAFVWPAFVLVLALGLTCFHKTLFKLLLGAVILINAVSLAGGWTKDWSYGPATDYRAAAEFASRWQTEKTILVYGGRAGGPAQVYFPGSLARIDWLSYLQDRAGGFADYERVIVLSDDWRDVPRESMNEVLSRLHENYTCVDARVDFPLFEYVFERRRADKLVAPSDATVTQLQLPLSLYGLEFQDLKLPIALDAKGAQVKIAGTSQLSNNEDNSEMTFSMSRSGHQKQLVLFTNATFDHPPVDGAAIAELGFSSASKVVGTAPLRVGNETASWDENCRPGAKCETVFHWRKKLAVVNRNSYDGAWRDFMAGIHAVVIDLPNEPIDSISIRYLANSGHLYIWAAAVK